MSLYSLQEEFHLFVKLQNKLVPSLELQYSISYKARGYIHCMVFPDPFIICDKTKDEFVKFVNIANRFILYGCGRFWIDLQSNDFAYEALISASKINENVEYIEKQIFDIPIAHFTDMQNPLYMLKIGEWKADQAIQYFEEIRVRGYVDNSDYGLW